MMLEHFMGVNDPRPPRTWREAKENVANRLEANADRGAALNAAEFHHGRETTRKEAIELAYDERRRWRRPPSSSTPTMSRTSTRRRRASAGMRHERARPAAERAPARAAPARGSTERTGHLRAHIMTILPRTLNASLRPCWGRRRKGASKKDVSWPYKLVGSLALAENYLRRDGEDAPEIIEIHAHSSEQVKTLAEIAKTTVGIKPRDNYKKAFQGIVAIRPQPLYVQLSKKYSSDG